MYNECVVNLDFASFLPKIEFIYGTINTCNFKIEPQFIYELQVPVNGLQHRIDQDSIFGLYICQQVGVGAAFRFKQLKTDNI